MADIYIQNLENKVAEISINDKNNNNKNDENVKNETKTEELSAKQKKKNLTSYWGVELDNNAFDHAQIKQLLADKPALIPLKKIHSTLLYVGKKENEKEASFKDFEGDKCTVVVDGFGHSEDSLALRVKEIYNNENKQIPSFAEKQHITMALKDKIPAKDSVKTLQGHGTVVMFDQPLLLAGTVKKYLF